MKSEELFVDGQTYGCTYWRTFQTPSNVIRSTQRCRPKRSRPNKCATFSWTSCIL